MSGEVQISATRIRTAHGLIAAGREPYAVFPSALTLR